MTNPEFRVRVEPDEPFDMRKYVAQQEYEYATVIDSHEMWVRTRNRRWTWQAALAVIVMAIYCVFG